MRNEDNNCVACGVSLEASSMRLIPYILVVYISFSCPVQTTMLPNLTECSSEEVSCLSVTSVGMNSLLLMMWNEASGAKGRTKQ